MKDEVKEDTEEEPEDKLSEDMIGFPECDSDSTEIGCVDLTKQLSYGPRRSRGLVSTGVLIWVPTVFASPLPFTIDNQPLLLISFISCFCVSLRDELLQDQAANTT